MNSEGDHFPSTHWSQVKVLQQGDDIEAGRAFEDLCQRYWYPIYAFLRRSGHTPADAEDLTQGFFHRLIAERALHTADPAHGRLRSYLLGVLKRLLSDQNRHDMAVKRGGGESLVSFDHTDAEEIYRLEPPDLNSPDRQFDRAWAVRLLANATNRLREDFVQGDNIEAFDHLIEFLPLGENATPYREVAMRMGVEEHVVRLQVHRMRQRYRKLIELEVGQTVRDAGQIIEELAHLMTALGR